MKEIISCILLSISANLDNVMIGLSFGNRNKKIPLCYVLLIGGVITFVTSLAVFCGNYITNYLSSNIANIIGALSLIIIGIYSLFMKEEDTNIDKSENIISFKTSIILSISLSLNNSIICLAGGISGVNKMITTIFTFIFSTFFLLIGNYLGRKINTKIVGIITSILLIIFGIFEYIY